MFPALVLGAALTVGQEPEQPVRNKPVLEFAGAVIPAHIEQEPPPPDKEWPRIDVTAPILPAPTPAPAAAAAAPGAAAPPYRWLLMRELQGTWMGECLDTERASVYGWVQGSFTASTTDDTNAPMSWNDQANKFLLQQAWVRLDRPVVTTPGVGPGLTTEPTYGGRVDMIFGTDYRYTLPQRGLLFSQRNENNGGFFLYGFDPVQFYGEAFYPTIGRGLDVKVGRFYTPYGVESIEAVSTPLISHSYTFSNGSPFTHTGVLSTLTLTDVWTVQAGIVLGSDIFISEADEATFVGSVQWTQPHAAPQVVARNVVKFTTVVGSGRFNQDDNVNNINVVDVTWLHVFANRPNSYSTLHPEWTMPIPACGLSSQVETLFGFQYNVPGLGHCYWYSGVGYLNYQFTPRLAGVGRVELFEDAQGQRTGFAGLYFAPAVGLTFKPIPDVTVRPELRFDHNDETAAFDGHHSMATAAVDFIVRW